jgi:glycosyltransferase involved in cell wall biosynthesis
MYKNNKLSKNPLVTIITVVLNGSENLEETINSIINQTYKDFEYIVIDGGSTDGTLEIIKRYEFAIDYWVSESDNGISDAFNKGVELSSGTYINFQGNGDGFYSDDVLERVFSNINPEIDILIGCRVNRTDKYGKSLYISKYFKYFNKRSLMFKMSLSHQGIFTHKEYFEKYGLFDINNKYCMDYEHLLRSYHEFPKVITKNIILANWREDGLGCNKELEIFEEYDKIKRDNKISSDSFLSIIKYWTLFKYYIKKVKYV